MVFFVNFGSEIEIGNNTKLGQKLGFKSISVMNLAKAKKELNWQHTITFKDMVSEMVQEDIKLSKNE